MQNFDVCEPIDLEDIKQVLYFDIRLGFNDFGRNILIFIIEHFLDNIHKKTQINDLLVLLTSMQVNY